MQREITKKLLKYLGFGILSVVVFFVIIFLVTMVGGIDKEKVFVPYIETSIPRLTTWDINEYRSLMSEEGMQAVTDEQWSLYLKKFSKLGSLKSVGSPELKNTRVMSPISEGTSTYADYLVPLEFDTGKAHVHIWLQYKNDKVVINRVEFLSDLLLQ